MKIAIIEKIRNMIKKSDDTHNKSSVMSKKEESGGKTMVMKQSLFLDPFIYEKDRNRGNIILKKYLGGPSELILEKKLGEYTVSVCKDCFAGCADLKAITIPYDLDFEISDKSFKGCSALENIFINGLDNSDPSTYQSQSALNKKLFDDNGVLFYTPDKSTILIFPENHRFEKYSVPDGIKTIDVIAPGNTLKSIVFPKSLREISFNVFRTDIEMYFQSTPKIKKINSYYWHNLEPIERKSPVHVQAAFSELIDIAKNRRWPIYIQFGKNEEFRPDGYPEMRINTSIIKGTDELEITGGTAVRGNVIIPDKKDGYPVVRIGKNAFRNVCFDSLTLPDSIREIGEHAFEGCSIKEIILPSSVRLVGALAFARTTMKRICFSGGQCKLEFGVFSDSKKLEEVEIDAEINCIPEDTFRNCKSLTLIKLSDKTEIIGENAFRGCTHMKSIILPHGLKTIGSAAFMDSGLAELTIPEDVSEIPEHLCHWCRQLERVWFSPNIKKIGFMSFYDCQKLASIPNIEHLEMLGGKAFENCSLLKSINAVSVETMGEDALAGTGWANETKEVFLSLGNILVRYCGSDEDVTIPDGITVIGDHAFMEYTGTYHEKPWMTSSVYQGNKKIKSITIGTHVKYIGKNAFFGCENLETLILQNSEVKIGKEAFRGTKLLKITGKYFKTVEDMLDDVVELADRIAISAEIRRILPGAFSGQTAKKIKTLIIGEGIRKLDNQEFASCQLDELVIPSTVSEISENAFSIERWTHSDGKKENKLIGIGKIICTKESPVIRIAGEYGIKLEIVEEQMIFDMMTDVRQEMASNHTERYLRCDSVILGHKLLGQVREDFSLEKAIQNFEVFVEDNANENMLELLYQKLLGGMQKYGIASDHWSSNWSAIAVTAAFLSQYGYLTDDWYHLTNKWYSIPNGDFMPKLITSTHPILACYKYMRSNYCENPEIRNAINYSCVYEVTVVNKHALKQAWQSPYNYCYLLYEECSKAQSDKERIIYNRLIGVLRLMAEMYELV